MRPMLVAKGHKTRRTLTEERRKSSHDIVDVDKIQEHVEH